MQDLKTLRKRILTVYAAGLCLGLAYYLWGQLTGWYIPCLVYTSTGLLCPGCGTTRMVLALTKLDIALAVSCNPVVFSLLLLWNLIALLLFWGKPAVVRRPAVLYAMLAVTVAALLVYGVFRNFP